MVRPYYSVYVKFEIAVGASHTHQEHMPRRDFRGE